MGRLRPALFVFADMRVFTWRCWTNDFVGKHNKKFDLKTRELAVAVRLSWREAVAR